MRTGRGQFPKRFRTLLEAAEPANVWPSFVDFCERASAADLIAAYRASRNELTKMILCDWIGNRTLQPAVPTLVRSLRDASPGVRASADALGKIGDRRCGFDIMARLEAEEDIGVRHNLVAGLGGVGYRPGIPFLIAALDDPDQMTRQMAAWSLGKMGARQALEALRRAAEKESGWWTKHVMKEALGEVLAVPDGE